MTVIEDSKYRGVVKSLCIHTDKQKDISTTPSDAVNVSFAGFEADSHTGLTRQACVRVKKQYQSGTVIRNTRQISIVSAEELQKIAEAMNIALIQPEWLGANLCVDGIPDFTHVPPASRLLFSGGAALVIDVENEPCKYPADIIDKHYPGSGKLFVKNAMHCRGVTAWVEREGLIRVQDEIEVHVPVQRQWKPA